MKFFAVLSVFGLAAIASAAPQAASESTSTTDLTLTPSESSSQTPTATATVSLTPAQVCINSCGATDICCTAACVGVPCPNDAQVNATTTCAAQCPQGNGTLEETAQYASCQQSCISSNFLTSTGSVGVATATGSTAATNSATTTRSGSSATGTSGSSTASSTASGSAASASASGTANNIQLGTAGAGIFALLVAGLAL